MFSLEEMVVKGLARKTGFPVTCGAMGGNLFSGRFHLEDFHIGNPDGFPLKEFVSVAGARLHFSPGSLLGKNIQVREFAVHLRELTGVRAKSGEVNIERFRHALERSEPSKSGGQSFLRNIHIARLTVRVDRIATVDCASLTRERRDYPVFFEREFEDVRDLMSVGPPVIEHFGVAGLSHLTNSIFATLLPEILWREIGAAVPL